MPINDEILRIGEVNVISIPGNADPSIFDSAKKFGTTAYDTITDTNFLVNGGLALVGSLFASKVSRPSLKFASLAATTQVALGVGQALKAGASTISEIANASKGRSSPNVLPVPVNVINLSSDIDNKVGKETKTTEFIKFPLDLPNAYSMSLTFYKYETLRGFNEANPSPIQFIRLPLPANLVDVITLQYNNIQAGPFRGAFLENINEFAKQFEGTETLQQMGELFGGLGRDLVQTITDGSTAKVIGRSMLQKVSPTTASALDIALGNTVNPHNIITFNGVGLRSYRFSWKLSPNEQKESDELSRLIIALKRNTLPSKYKGGELVLNFPNFVRVKLNPPILSDLFAFRTLVMDQASFNFAPSGSLSFHGDDTPTEVEITVSLREVDIQTAEDYDDASFRYSAGTTSASDIRRQDVDAAMV